MIKLIILISHDPVKIYKQSLLYRLHPNHQGNDKPDKYSDDGNQRHMKNYSQAINIPNNKIKNSDNIMTIDNKPKRIRTPAKK